MSGMSESLSTPLPAEPSTTLPPDPAPQARVSLFGRWLINVGAFGASDVLMLALAFYGAGLTRLGLIGGAHMLPQWSWYVTGLWVLLSSGIKLNPGWGMGVVESTRRLCLLLLTIYAGTTSALFLTQLADATSRLVLSLAFFYALILLPLGRWLVKKMLIHHGLWGMQVVIYGTQAKLPLLLQVLREESGMGYCPVGLFVVDGRADLQELDGIPCLPASMDPCPFAHAAILLEPESITDHRPDFMEIASFQYRKALLVPELREHAPSLWVTPRDLGGVLSMEISSNLLDGWSRLLKLASETLIVLLFLPLALPLIALLSLLIFLWDFRNPFFVQTRIGHQGKPFRMLKFRTMRPNAEEVLQQRLERDPEFRRDWENGFKIKHDPRITGIGRFLRVTSLDELPQFFNVLRGEMALIGPRPLPAYHEQELPERIRDLRRRVRPGMTGLWQVSGRSETGNDGFIRWDAYYVRNWSIWLDLVILVRTIYAVLHKRGAY